MKVKREHGGITITVKRSAVLICKFGKKQFYYKRLPNYTFFNFYGVGFVYTTKYLGGVNNAR